MLKPSELSFDTLVKFFEFLKNSKDYKTRQKILETFYEKNIVRESNDAFSVFRLILPHLDNERSNYRLKHSKLTDAFIKALSLDQKESPQAKQAKLWRIPQAKGSPSKGGFGGQYADAMKDILFKSFCSLRDDSEMAKSLKVSQLNDKLDELSSKAGSIQQQANVIRWLFNHTTPRQMYWIAQIILGERLKLGTSETKILKTWHPDAQEVFDNSGMSLRKVFNELVDPSKRHQGDIRPGYVARPQLAVRTLSAEDAFKRLEKKHKEMVGGGGQSDFNFVIETKVDGERIQVHLKEDGSICYFSRRAIDHALRSHYCVMDTLFTQLIDCKTAILDGELIVYNKARNKFEEFGTLKGAANAAWDGKAPQETIELTDWEGNALRYAEGNDQLQVKDLELVYVAFDILYLDGKQQTGYPLEERYKVLKRIASSPSRQVRLLSDPASDRKTQMCGRIVPLIPNETVFPPGHTAAEDGTILYSRLCTTREEIAAAIERSRQKKEEGIMLKLLSSQWVGNDKSGTWLKIKPDYITNADIDALIIGASWGKGKRGASAQESFASFLVALVDNPQPGCDQPVSWISFAQVGSGVTDEERGYLHRRLEERAGFLDASANGGAVCIPQCYVVSGGEKPDVWIRNPMQSVVLQIHADLRLIRSSTFASPYSVRFPSIEAIRYDKPADQCTSIAEIVGMYGTLQGQLGGDGDGDEVNGSWSSSRKRKSPHHHHQPRRKANQVAEAFMLGEPSKVPVESHVLRGLVFWVVPFRDSQSHRTVEDIYSLVKRLGGSISANMSDEVTHVLAARASNRTLAEQENGNDVIALDWLDEVDALRKWVPVRPRHVIHIGKPSLKYQKKKKSSVLTECDEFGDSYVLENQLEDVKALVERHMDIKRIDPLAVGKALAELENVPIDTSGKNPEKRAVDSLKRYVEGVLRKAGLLDTRFSYMNEVTAVFVSAPPGERTPKRGSTASAPHFLRPRSLKLQEAAAEAEVAAGEEVKALLAVQIQLHGGSVSEIVDDSVTHLVWIPNEDDSPSNTPLKLSDLQSYLLAHSHAGRKGLLKALHFGFQYKTLHLVAKEWLDECFEEEQRVSDAPYVLEYTEDEKKAFDAERCVMDESMGTTRPIKDREKTAAAAKVVRGGGRRGRATRIGGGGTSGGHRQTIKATVNHPSAATADVEEEVEKAELRHCKERGAAGGYTEKRTVPPRMVQFADRQEPMMLDKPQRQHRLAVQPAEATSPDFSFDAIFGADAGHVERRFQSPQLEQANRPPIESDQGTPKLSIKQKIASMKKRAVE